MQRVIYPHVLCSWDYSLEPLKANKPLKALVWSPVTHTISPQLDLHLTLPTLPDYLGASQIQTKSPGFWSPTWVAESPEYILFSPLQEKKKVTKSFPQSKILFFKV